MFDYQILDPGIRDTVRRVHEAGFETTDSGDGVSKPAAGMVFPFPHVAAVSAPGTIIADADRLAAVLGPDWVVEAVYQTLTQSAYLFARTLFDEERAAAS